MFVVKSHLKVMLDEDYLALLKHNSLPNVNNLGNQIVRQIILPAIEQEVNTGKNFAQLRQIYNSMILAVWFKKSLKQALLNQVYTDKSKVNGVNVDDPAIKEKIYKQYLQAYKKGVFNYIKEEPADVSKGTTIPRKYFSGGLTAVTDLAMATADEVRVAFSDMPGETFKISGLTQEVATSRQVFGVGKKVTMGPGELFYFEIAGKKYDVVTDNYKIYVYLRDRLLGYAQKAREFRFRGLSISVTSKNEYVVTNTSGLEGTYEKDTAMTSKVLEIGKIRAQVKEFVGDTMGFWVEPSQRGALVTLFANDSKLVQDERDKLIESLEKKFKNFTFSRGRYEQVNTNRFEAEINISDAAMTADALELDILKLMKRLKLTDNSRFLTTMNMSVDTVFINQLAEKTGKSIDEILTALEQMDFFKPIAYLYRMRNPKVQLKNEDFKNRSVDITVSDARYDFQGQRAPLGHEGHELFQYMKYLGQQAGQVPFAFRDGMKQFVGRFLGLEDVTENTTGFPDLKDIVDGLEADFLNKITLGRIKYFVSSGIGANEMYSHQLSEYLHSLGITWIVVNNPDHMGRIPSDATNDNTVFFEMSRGGETKETYNFFQRTAKIFKKRVVAAIKGKLRAAGEELAKDNEAVVDSITDIPGYIGGRQMNRKTLMVAAPLFLALAVGYKDTNKAREGLKQYFNGLYEANEELAYKNQDNNTAVNLAELLLTQRTVGRKTIQLLYSGSLKGLANETYQLVNEGAQKYVAGGYENNNLVYEYNLNQPDDVARQQIGLEAGPGSVQPLFLLDKSSDDYEKMKAYAEQLKGMGLPVIVVAVDLRKGTSQADIAHNLKTIARTSALMQDTVVYFTYLTRQDASSNPAVKLVRELTEVGENHIVKIRQAGAKNPDIRMTVEDSQTDIQTSNQEKLAAAQESFAKAGEPAVESNQDFVLMKKAMGQLAEELNISEGDLVDQYLGSITKSVMQIDIGEAANTNTATIETAFGLAELNKLLGKFSLERTIKPVSQQDILENTPNKRVSIGLEEGESFNITGSTEDKVSQYLYDSLSENKNYLDNLVLTYMERDEGNPVISAIAKRMARSAAKVGLQTPMFFLPGRAHSGIEGLMARAQKAFNISIVYTEADKTPLGNVDIGGITVNDATYNYGISNVDRLFLGGSRGIIFEVKNDEQLKDIQDTITHVMDRFDQMVEKDKAMTAEAKILSQADLGKIFEAQQKGDLPTIQAMQGSLKKTMLNDYEQAWQGYYRDHPGFKAPFDLNNPDEQHFIYTKAEADATNLRGHYKEFVKKSNASTAGIRAFLDILHSENPNKMYNDRFLALLIDAEAEFLSDVHRGIHDKLSAIQDKKAFISDLRKNMGEKNVRLVEEIYGMPLESLIPFLQDNIVKLVGGEVRPHTAKFVEMESRILANRGIKVITTENYSDSVTIYMFSYLTYLLGAVGATHYTSSHSSNYMAGRKALAPNGAQLLPDVYEKYRTILSRKIEQEVYGTEGKTEVVMGRADNQNILKTLTYDRMTKLYSSILNLTPEDVKLINEATQKGQKIVLNCLNGSTWKTLKSLMKNLGINPDVFIPVMQEEDPYFNVGYVVTQKRSPTGEISYSIDHLGVDTTMPIVVRTIPYPVLLKGLPIGTRVYEADPDSDRFVVKQILQNTPEVKLLLSEYGVEYYPLEGDKILIAPSPNKSFLALDIADVENMIDNGTWDNYLSLHLITYVSSHAWVEFGDAVEGLLNIMARVGFKNLSELRSRVEEWYFNRPGEAEFTFFDNLGREITLNRNKQIRIHSAEEESGGRVGGLNAPSYNVLGDKVLAMPEKSAADSLFSEVLFSSKEFLAAVKIMPADSEINGPNVLAKAVEGNYSFLNFLDRSFRKYQLKSKIDVRIDIIHGNQGEIAALEYSEQQKALAQSEAIKNNFNNFFFSMAKAVRDRSIPLAQAIKMLTEVLPEYADTWKCLSAMTLTEEPLAGGKTMPEGVPMEFKPTEGKIPLVTGMSFRPSGTDPLKSKVYLDSEELSAPQRERFAKAFDELQNYNLYEVLRKYNVSPIIAKPDNFEQLGLKDFAMKGAAALAKIPGGIDLNSRNLNMQSEGEKVDITFDPAMIAQFRRGDFSGVRIQILDVVPVNLMPLLGLRESN